VLGVPGLGVYPLFAVLLVSVPPLRRVTFGKGAPKVTKRSSSRFGPTSSGSLTPATLRGHAAIGHPWPGAANAASMPRCPLRVACVRPAPKSRFGVSGLAWMKSKSRSEGKGKGKGKNQAALVLLIVPHAPRGNVAPDALRPMTRSVMRGATTRSVGAIGLHSCRDFVSATKCDFGRPSAGIAQGTARHGCRASRPRPWMADGGVSPEQCRSEGTRRRRAGHGSETFWLLLAGPASGRFCQK
jgi:hypothetical protein